MDIFSFVSLFGGLAMFLYGMDQMGDGLKNSSATTLKTVLSKVTSNVFTGFLLGAFIAALIQSSTATIVICVGLISAGMLELKQAVSITIGANVGTTVTAQIIRLLDINGASGVLLRLFQPEALAPIALIIGIILIKGSKKDTTKNVGRIAIGFGILFIGLLTMTEAMAPLADSPAFKSAIVELSKVPVLTLLIAMAFTALMTSSSATVGVLQTLCSTGLITFRIAYFYVVGAAIGTCITAAFLSGIGAKSDGKRLAYINVIFNITGAVVLIAIMEILYRMGYLQNLMQSTVTSGGVANFQTAYKLINAIVFLPLVPFLINLSYRIVKDDPQSSKKTVAADRFDTNLFRSPALALRYCDTVVGEIGKEVNENFELAIGQVIGYDEGVSERIADNEEYVDELTDRCSQYLVELSPFVVSDLESENLEDLLQALSEFERIGDLAVNIEEMARNMHKNGKSFSESAIKETKVLARALNGIIGLAEKAFGDGDVEAAKNIEPLEEVIDDLVEYTRESHIKRLKNGECSIDAGIAFLDMLTNMERIGDQCSNLALLVLKNHYPEINKHEYINHLHGGEDEFFNREYARLSKEYMDEIQSAEIEA